MPRFGRKLLASSERAAAAVSLALLALALFFLDRVFTGRALFLRAGALLGTIMANQLHVSATDLDISRLHDLVDLLGP